jgi:hypothetical protein
MAAVDLKARRAARQEKLGPPPQVAWDDIVFTLPLELPLTFTEKLNEGDISGALRMLLGDRAQEFYDLVQPTLGDLAEISELFGRSLGESSASTAS